MRHMLFYAIASCCDRHLALLEHGPRELSPRFFPRRGPALITKFGELCGLRIGPEPREPSCPFHVDTSPAAAYRIPA